MKKLLWFIVCLMTMMTFTSCGDNVETEAKNNMESLMKDIAKNPKSLEITNIKTIFKSDSCVVLKYKASGQNGFGGYHKSEYVYIFSVYKFNIIGVKKMHALLQIDYDGNSTEDEIEREIWTEFENTINTKKIDSIQAEAVAINIILGRDVESNESMSEILAKITH